MQTNDIRADMAQAQQDRDRELAIERRRQARARRQAEVGNESGQPLAETAASTGPNESNTVGPLEALRHLGAQSRDGMGNIARDVGTGVIETPGALYAGFADAVNETVDLTEEAGIQAAMALMRIGYDADPEVAARVGDVARQIMDERPELLGMPGDVLPEGPEQDSMTGNTVRGITQFLVGFVGAGKITKPIQALQGTSRLARWGRPMLNGAIADFAVFDGTEDRLSDLLEEHPELSNPITEFLAADEEDPELLGRLKNTIEGAGLGALTDAVFAGIRARGHQRRLQRSAARIEAEEVRLDESAAEEIQRDIIDIGGNPTGPLVVPGSSASEMRDQVHATMREMSIKGEMQPAEVEAMMAAAERWAERVRASQPEIARTLDDLNAEWVERGDPTVVNRLMDMMDEARAPIERPSSLSDFVRAGGGLMDEGGEMSARDFADRLNAFTRTADRQSLDDAALRAWEAGYLGPQDGPRPTINDFLDALDRDARAAADGDLEARVFSDADADLADQFRARETLIEELDELELDFSQRSFADRLDSAQRAAGETDVQAGEPVTARDMLSIDEAMEAAGARYGIEFPDAGDLGGNDVRINFNALNTGDDVRSIIGQLADRYAGEIDAARGTARGNDVLFDEASDLGNAWRILESRRAGAALTDAEVIAAQRLYVASGENVRRLAQRALENADSDMAQFALRRGMAVHRAIQAEIAGAKAAAGRALRAWQVVTGSNQSARMQLQGTLNSFGGRMSRRDLARLTEMLPEELDKTTRFANGFEAAAAVGADVLRFAWLSGPHTHIMNMAGNSLTAIYDTLPRLGAGLKGRLLGDPELERQLGAALAQYSGLRAGLSAQFRAFARSADYERMGRRLGEILDDYQSGRMSLKDALRNSAAAVWEDNPVAATARARFDDMGVSGRKFEDGYPNAVSAERFGVRDDSAAGTFLNGVGRVLSAPTDFLGWQDDFFKGVNEVAERHALAYEQAARELDEGVITREAFDQRYADLVESPSEEILDGARTAAQRRTFTEPVGQMTRDIMSLRKGMNSFGLPIGHILLPFVVTPSNILKFAFQSSPFGILFREMRDDLAAGGARRAMAQSRIAAGTGLLMLGADLASNGQITGAAPNDPGARELWERSGIQEYSVRVGNRWVSYRRLEPVSTMIAIAADWNNIASNIAMNDNPDVDLSELLGPVLGASIRVITDKTYLTSLSQFIQFVEDPERFGPTWIERMASSIAVPAGVAQIERAIDPEIRDTHDIVTAALARVPGYSEEIPQAYDVWGRPRIAQSGVSRTYDVLSPFTIRTVDPEPIDTELYRIGYFPRPPAPRLSVVFNGQSVPVNLRNAPEIYQRYVQLAGNGAQIPGQGGALDYLNALVSGQRPESRDYMAAPDNPDIRGSKADRIERVMSGYRNLARNIVLREYQSELTGMARDVVLSRDRAFGERDGGAPLLERQ